MVGACDKLVDPNAPVWTGGHLTNLEALGGGTLAWDAAKLAVSPHIHLTVGSRERPAVANSSYLLSATVQVLTEMIIVEVTSPLMHRLPNAELYDVLLLHFTDN